MLPKQRQRIRRHARVTAKIKGTSEIPRLCIFRSNKYIYAQLINDREGFVIASARDKKSLTEAGKVGKDIAEKAKSKKIEKVVFDRGGYKYHGRVKALADEARKGGLVF